MGSGEGAWAVTQLELENSAPSCCPHKYASHLLWLLPDAIPYIYTHTKPSKGRCLLFIQIMQFYLNVRTILIFILKYTIHLTMIVPRKRIILSSSFSSSSSLLLLLFFFVLFSFLLSPQVSYSGLRTTQDHIK